MLQVYSKIKDGNKKLSENFKVSEFASTDGADTIFIDTELVEILQRIRNHFNKPLLINSGYRTESRNKSVGGAKFSQHMYGKASDVRIIGIPPSEIAKCAEKLLINRGGIGLYKTFVHIDVRENKSRWKG